MLMQSKEKKTQKVDFKETEMTPKFTRNVKSQIEEFFQILADQKKEAINEKVKQLQSMSVKRNKEELIRRSFYNKSLLNRPAFYNRPRNLTTFSNQKNVYLDSSGNIGNVKRETVCMPPRYYEHGGMNFMPPRQQNMYEGFGKPPLKYMSKSGIDNLNNWEEIHATLREDGRYKKMKIDRKNRLSPKIFKPSDSKEKIFDLEKSFYSSTGINDEPSQEKIVQIEKGVLLNSKSSRKLFPDMPTDRSFSNASHISQNQTNRKTWRPNTLANGYFNKNPYKNQNQGKQIYIVEDYIGNKKF